MSDDTMNPAHAPHDGPCLLCNALVAENERLKAERDQAQSNYQFMVERAADEKLDGYRELGARCAALEDRADALKATNALLVEALLYLVDETGGKLEAILRHWSHTGSLECPRCKVDEALRKADQK